MRQKHQAPTVAAGAAAAWKLTGRVSCASGLCPSTSPCALESPLHMGWSDDRHYLPELHPCVQEEHQVLVWNRQAAGSRVQRKQLGRGLRLLRSSSST